jgi:hypothetical protein
MLRLTSDTRLLLAGIIKVIFGFAVASWMKRLKLVKPPSSKSKDPAGIVAINSGQKRWSLAWAAGSNQIEWGKRVQTLRIVIILPANGFLTSARNNPTWRSRASRVDPSTASTD